MQRGELLRVDKAVGLMGKGSVGKISIASQRRTVPYAHIGYSWVPPRYWQVSVSVGPEHEENPIPIYIFFHFFLQQLAWKKGIASCQIHISKGKKGIFKICPPPPKERKKERMNGKSDIAQGNATLPNFRKVLRSWPACMQRGCSLRQPACWLGAHGLRSWKVIATRGHCFRA